MTFRNAFWAAAFLTFFSIHVPAATLYVNLNSTNPVSPYADWSTAATKIQDAVDAAPAHSLIIVTNGVYATGGRAMTGDLTNRVALNKPMLTLQSVGGPAVTVIQGRWDPMNTNGPGAVRCVGLAFSARLDGFTLLGGATRSTGDYDLCTGGGVWCAASNCIVTNCIIIRNSASAGGGAYRGQFINCVIATNRAGGDGGGNCDSVLNNCSLIGNLAFHAGGGMMNSSATNCVFFLNTAGEGGGASGTLFNCTIVSNTASIGGGVWSSTAVNCLISGNSATNAGGGAYYANLNNCTVVGNSAQSRGGGVAGAQYYSNCIIYYNTASSDSNCDSKVTLANCCTTPAHYGVGNITNEPAFVDPAGGDFHLSSNSPCINSGNNTCVTSTTDLDGNPRIVGSTVDIGAYEYQTPASRISYAWLQQYGLPINTNTDIADPDGDGMNNYQEWIAGTNPTNALSLLEMLNPAPANNPAGLVASWESVSNRTYFLQSSTNLGMQPAFTTVQSNIPGQTGTTSYTDTRATNAGPYFYRVGVQQ